MRQEVARLVEQVDAQLVVFDADVHVHAADDEAAADAGQVLGERLVALALGVLLGAPAGERVGRGGDGGEVVFGGHVARRPCAGGPAPRPPPMDERCTLVPTSICDFRNSRATWSPSALLAASNRPCGISRTRSRLARSTRRYSSSMPMVNEGSLSGMPAWWHESRERHSDGGQGARKHSETSTAPLPFGERTRGHDLRVRAPCVRLAQRCRCGRKSFGRTGERLS